MIRLQQNGSGLGSDIVLTLRTPDERSAQLAFRSLWTVIHTFNQRFSRFLADSELSRFNKRAGQTVAVSHEFRALLSTSLDYSRQTNGLFSPLVLPALQRAGYVGSWPQVDHFDTELDYRRRKGSDVTDVRLKERQAVLAQHAAIDFGGIGKGYLLDQLADLLDTKHVKHYWLSLGGDIITTGYDNDNRPWEVGIAKAESSGESLTTAINHSGERLAVATSGITKRRGADWHHIIDPRTGSSARTDVLTATLTGGSATAVDVYATCLIILGSVAAPDFIATHDIDGALLQTAASHHRYGSLA